MSQPADTNAEIWKSSEIAQNWASEANERERHRVGHRDFMASLLPFGEQDAFTFLDLGAGTGAAAAAILERYPRSRTILSDFSPQMMAEGEREMLPFAGRFEYVEFDMSTSAWPEVLNGGLDAVISSLCVHHLPDDRKRALFAEIHDRLVPGGWYLNYDPVTSDDAIVEAAWQRVNDRGDPHAAARREHRTAQERARYENHVRYMIPLDPQLEYLRSAGFRGVDVYWKQLENVIYGGCRA